jgi:hypothetical protein
MNLHRTCLGVIVIVSDTGGDFAAGVADTSGKFAPGVIDTGGAPLLANISVNFRKNLKRSLCDRYSWAGGKLIHEKNQKQKIS